MTSFNNALLYCQENHDQLPQAFLDIPMKETRRKIFAWLWNQFRTYKTLNVTIKDIAIFNIMSERTVFLALSELEEFNLIRRTKVGKYNRYELVQESEWIVSQRRVV